VKNTGGEAWEDLVRRGRDGNLASHAGGSTFGHVKKSGASSKRRAEHFALGDVGHDGAIPEPGDVGHHTLVPFQPEEPLHLLSQRFVDEERERLKAKRAKQDEQEAAVRAWAVDATAQDHQTNNLPRAQLVPTPVCHECKATTCRWVCPASDMASHLLTRAPAKLSSKLDEMWVKLHTETADAKDFTCYVLRGCSRVQNYRIGRTGSKPKRSQGKRERNLAFQEGPGALTPFLQCFRIGYGLASPPQSWQL
jgi:hypothetical protein